MDLPRGRCGQIALNVTEQEKWKMSEGLAKCPDCKEACKCEHATVMGFNFWAVGHTNDSEGCPYSVQAATKANAIALHNRLAGRCRWVEDLQEDHWTIGCSGELIGYKSQGPYCTFCGKQIEEVSE